MNPMSTDPLPSQLRELVTVYLYQQRRHIAEQGLPPQGRLLLHLKRMGAVTQAEFGRAVGLDKSWISRVVDRFVTDGHVERVPLPQDRRCLQLRLTPAGAALAARVDEQLSAHAARLLAGIPDADRPAIGRALAHLTEAMQPVELKDIAA